MLEEDKIKSQTQKKTKAEAKLGKVNAKIEKLDNVQNFMSAIRSKDKEVRHRGFVTGLESIADIRIEKLNKQLAKTGNKLDVLSAELKSAELKYREKFEIENAIRPLQNKSSSLTKKIESMQKLRSDLNDIRNGKYTEAEVEKAVSKTASKISERLESTAGAEAKGIVNHIIAQTAESGKESILEVSAERNPVQKENFNPQLDRKRVPDERNNTKKEEEKILNAVAAVTEISVSELNRLPVDMKTDIISEFQNNNGNISTNQLVERIYNIADIELPEKFRSQQNLHTQEKPKEREPRKDKPLFSRSRIMTDEFKPTSQKSQDDKEHKKDRSMGIE